MRDRTRRTLLRGAAIIPLLGAGVAVAPAAFAASPARVVQAEAYASQVGARTEPTSDPGGGRDVGWLANGDRLSYASVDLGAGGAERLTVRLAAAPARTGSVEFRADRASGPLLARVPVTPTGGWQRWESRTATVADAPRGAHRIVVLLRSPRTVDFVNLDWFSFTAASQGADPVPSTAPSTGAPTMPGMPGMTTPPAGRWITVDRRAEAAATEAFFARTPARITGSPVRVPEFHATCTVSHRAKDDPIVFPGMAGASHEHSFIGNVSTSATSTVASLSAAATTCTPKDDHSAYWIPTLYASGRAVDPTDVTVYYGSRLKDPSRTQPFPAGFREITGDPRVQTDTPDHQGNHFWCAGRRGTVGRSADGTMPICGAGANLVRQITFADCWDGVHLDSPDHRSHVSNAVDGACPADFPVAIPNVSFVIGYPVGLDVQHVALASGTTFSMHGDFFDAWDDDALDARVRNCLDQGVKCAAQGGF